MRNSDLDLIALLTKGLHDLRARFDRLAREPGPEGLAGVDGKDGRDGRDGVDGKDGRDGLDGINGLNGSDGLDGAQGERGEIGPQGEEGPRGAKGATGEKGDTGPMPDHEWRGTELRFQKPDGTWGAWVDLKGAKGTRGDRGPSGGGGGYSAPAPGGGIEQSIYVDASRPIAYVGYSTRIVRLDYATWPPVETTATTPDVHAAWPNRASLEYA